MINRRHDGRASCLARQSSKQALERKPRIHAPATWKGGHESGEIVSIRGSVENGEGYPAEKRKKYQPDEDQNGRDCRDRACRWGDGLVILCEPEPRKSGYHN
jgi:hypothetical protein